MFMSRSALVEYTIFSVHIADFLNYQLLKIVPIEKELDD